MSLLFFHRIVTSFSELPLIRWASISPHHRFVVIGSQRSVYPYFLASKTIWAILCSFLIRNSSIPSDKSLSLSFLGIIFCNSSFLAQSIWSDHPNLCLNFFSAISWDFLSADFFESEAVFAEEISTHSQISTLWVSYSFHSLSLIRYVPVSLLNWTRHSFPPIRVVILSLMFLFVQLV